MSDIKKLKEAYLAVVSGKVEVNEGTLMREYERGEFRKGDEKRFVALIKKNGGKNIDVETPTGGDSMLNIQFKGGNIKRMQQDLAKIDDGLTSIEEKVSEDIDPELLKKAAVGKKKADDEEKDGKKAVPAGKDVDVDDEKSDDDEKPVKKKKKDDDEEEVEEDNSNDKSDDGEGLDKVQPKATKKKFKDRKDKDIDNDGDVDSSDKFLHKRRKAVSKAMAEESVEEDLDEAKYPKKSKFPSHEYLPKSVQLKGFDKKKKKGLKKSGNSKLDGTDTVKLKGFKGKKLPRGFEQVEFEESTADLIEALSNVFEGKETAGAEKGEAIDSKESGQAKAFADLHKKSDKKIEDNYDDAVDKTTKAGKGGPSPKKRPGDNSNGDPAPKGVKEESELIKRTLEQLRLYK